MSAPLVSVLMTAFNREKYIGEAIESVLASTFEDFELIIVDDGSNDRTVEIGRRYTADPRVVVHENAKNLGDYLNRNRAAELAGGKYLKYVDSDDMIYPHGLEVMVNSMERFPEAALGLCAKDSQRGLYPVCLSPEAAYHEHFVLRNGLLSPGPTDAIIRTKNFFSLGGFSGKRFIGDSEMWLKFAAHFPLVKIVRGLTWYRVHATQSDVMGNQSSINEANTESLQLDTLAARYQLTMDALESTNCPLKKGEKKRVVQNEKSFYAWRLLQLALRQRQPRFAVTMYRRSNLTLTDMMTCLIHRFASRDA